MSFVILHRSLLLQATLLISIGLWDLFAVGLPPLTTNMLHIFKDIFPIIIGTLFLFLSPLIRPDAKWLLWAIVLLNLLLAATALRFAIGADGPKCFRMALLLVSALGLSLLYIRFLWQPKH